MRMKAWKRWNQKLQLPDELWFAVRDGSVVPGIKLRNQSTPCNDSLPMRLIPIFSTARLFKRGYRLRLIPVIDESSSAPACPAWCLARHGFDAELAKKAVAAGADGRALGHEAIIHQHYENVHY